MCRDFYKIQGASSRHEKPKLRVEWIRKCLREYLRERTNPKRHEDRWGRGLFVEFSFTASEERVATTLAATRATRDTFCDPRSESLRGLDWGNEPSLNRVDVERIRKNNQRGILFRISLSSRLRMTQRRLESIRRDTSQTDKKWVETVRYDVRSESSTRDWVRWYRMIKDSVFITLNSNERLLLWRIGEWKYPFNETNGTIIIYRNWTKWISVRNIYKAQRCNCTGNREIERCFFIQCFLTIRWRAIRMYVHEKYSVVWSRI